MAEPEGEAGHAEALLLGRLVEMKETTAKGLQGKPGEDEKGVLEDTWCTYTKQLMYELD